MRWPAAPTCHDGSARWKAPRRDDTDGYRSCSFCTGIHPEDFVRRAEASAIGDAIFYPIHLLDVGYDEEAMLMVLEALRQTEATRVRELKPPE
jgi:hypothetical protein